MVALLGGVEFDTSMFFIVLLLLVCEALGKPALYSPKLAAKAVVEHLRKSEVNQYAVRAARDVTDLICGTNQYYNKRYETCEECSSLCPDHPDVCGANGTECKDFVMPSAATPATDEDPANEALKIIIGCISGCLLIILVGVLITLVKTQRIPNLFLYKPNRKTPKNVQAVGDVEAPGVADDNADMPDEEEANPQGGRDPALQVPLLPRNGSGQRGVGRVALEMFEMDLPVTDDAGRMLDSVHSGNAADFGSEDETIQSDSLDPDLVQQGHTKPLDT